MTDCIDKIIIRQSLISLFNLAIYEFIGNIKQNFNCLLEIDVTEYKSATLTDINTTFNSNDGDN